MGLDDLIVSEVAADAHKLKHCLGGLVLTWEINTGFFNETDKLNTSHYTHQGWLEKGVALWLTRLP